MGAKRFLMFLAFLSIAEIFRTMASTCITVSDSSTLTLAVPVLEPAWMLQHR
jgi:hypothetical protein